MSVDRLRINAAFPYPFSVGEGRKQWHNSKLDGAQNRIFIGVVHEKALANYTKIIRKLYENGSIVTSVFKKEKKDNLVSQ